MMSIVCALVDGDLSALRSWISYLLAAFAPFLTILGWPSRDAVLVPIRATLSPTGGCSSLMLLETTLPKKRENTVGDGRTEAPSIPKSKPCTRYVSTITTMNPDKPQLDERIRENLALLSSRRSETRQQALEAVLAAIDEEPPALKSTLGALLRHGEPGSREIRKWCLQRLPQQAALLEFLPAVVAGEKVTPDVLGVLHELLQNDVTSITGILLCLSRIQISDDDRLQALQWGLTSMPLLPVVELPMLLMEMMQSYLTTEAEWVSFIERVRDEWKGLQTDDGSETSSEVALSVLRQCTQGCALARSYFKAMQSTDLEHDEVLALDVLVLIFLANEDDAAARLLDSWMQSTHCPHALVRDAILFSFEIESLHEVMADAMVTFCLSLVVAPIRRKDPLTQEVTLQLEDLVILIHENSSLEQQKEIVQSLLHLSDSVPVHGILLRLAESDPQSLVRFQYDLRERLLRPDAEYVQETCVVLVKITELDDLTVLLQKLLFSSHSVVQGLVLAKEVIQLPHLPVDRASEIINWAYRILLPSTQRMVDPATGLAGLAFVLASGEDKDATFTKFKLILANTGLVQEKTRFVRTRKNYTSFLAYDEPDGATGDADAATKGRSIVLAAAFFLRHLRNTHDPRSWSGIVKWIYKLLDTYLALGRRRSGHNWIADGWLRATIELPKKVVKGASSRTPGDKQIRLQFSHLSLERMELLLHIEDLSFRDFKLLQVIINETLMISLSLLTACCVQFAILKNVVEHDSQFTKSSGAAQLVDGVFTRLYDIQGHIDSLAPFLRQLASACRSPPTRKAGRKGPNTEFSVEDDERSKRMSKQLHEAKVALLTKVDMFSSFDFAKAETLWRCLSCSHADALVRSMLRSLQARDEVSPKDVADLISSVALRLRVLEQLYSGYASSSEQARVPASLKGDVARVLELAVLIVRSAPTILKVEVELFGMDDGESRSLYHISVSFADSVLALVARILMSAPNAPDSTGKSTPLSYQDLIDLLYCSLSQSLVEGDSVSESAPQMVDDLHRRLTAMLRSVDELPIADSLLEVMSLTVRNEESRLLPAVLSANLSAMHTIYRPVSSDVYGDCEAFDSVLRAFGVKATTREELALRNVAHSLAGRYELAGACSPSFWAYRTLVLRHFGLLCQLDDQFANLDQHFYNLMTELRLVLAAELDSMESISKSSSKRAKRTRKSSIQGLSSETFLDYYELVLHLLVISIAMIDPADVESSSDTCGPYRRISALLDLFHHLLDMYKTYFALFPNKFAVVMVKIAKSLLVVVDAQISRCVDWRNHQPLPDPEAQRSGAYDAGSVKYLQQLLDDVTRSALSPLLSLCSYWQTEDSARSFASRSSTVQQAVEKATRSLNGIAQSHNLKPLDTTKKSRARAFPKCKEAPAIRGFHEQPNNMLTTSTVRASSAATKGPTLTTILQPKKKKRRVAILSTTAVLPTRDPLAPSAPSGTERTLPINTKKRYSIGSATRSESARALAPGHDEDDSSDEEKEF